MAWLVQQDGTSFIVQQDGVSRILLNDIVATTPYGFRITPAWFPDPELPRGSFRSGFVVQATQTVIAPVRIGSWYSVDPAPLQGRITTGYAVTTTVAPVIFAGRIVPALFPVELLPTGKVTTGYQVTTVVPPPPPAGGRQGVLPPLEIEPFDLAGDDEAILLALALLA